MSDTLLSILLGIIQGLTEFLPISSSAHLLFPNLIFGTNDLGLSFDIAVHFGTLIAVIFYFKEDISLMLQSLATRNSTFPREKKLFGLLVVATIPIVLVGFGVSDILEQRLFNTFTIALSNIVFAILLLLVFLQRKENLRLVDLTFKAALIIGIFQCFALIPGASRSGTAITGAILIGLTLKDSAKFAFLLSIPTILGALVFLISDINEISLNYSTMIIGFFTSMLFAFFTIKYFLAFVDKVGMIPFVVYRLILGVVLLALL